MRDRYGNEMRTFVVSGRVEEQKGCLSVTLTVLLKSKMETRKLDIKKEVFPASPESIDSCFSDKDFGSRTGDVRKAVQMLIKKEPGAGKFFVREAFEAYGVRDKLRPEQIEEALTGAFLVSRIHDL